MPAPGVTLTAHLVVDNSLLVMLVEYFLERRGRAIPAVRLVGEIQRWMTDQLALLARQTPDGKLHCTDGVALEFNPRAGRMREMPGIRIPDCDAVGRCVRERLCCSCEEPEEIRYLRQLPTAPRRLVGPSGLSDNDLSLLVRGLQLTSIGQTVYILTNDQDLLQFTSWACTQASVRSRWPKAQQLNGLFALLYLDAIHRNCYITTEEMNALMRFALTEHYNRADIAGSVKGQVITQKLLDIYSGMVESVRIKQLFKEVAA
jgi:hypothetical protein